MDWPLLRLKGAPVSRKQWYYGAVRHSVVPLPTEEASVDRHTVTLSVIASNMNSCSWSNQPMKFQGSVDAAKLHIRFHRLCTQLFTHGVAAFCSCFSSAIMSHNVVDIEKGILLAIYILLPAGIVLGRGTAEGELLWSSKISGEKDGFIHYTHHSSYSK